MEQQETLPWTTLAELSYLRRLQKYQRRKSDYIEHRLHWLETSCEARNRITQGAKELRNELTESVQSGDRNKFSLLFNTFHTLKQACDEWDAQSPVPERLSNHSPEYRIGSFMDGVSPDTRETLLTFLSRVSFDPSFLLGRLLELPEHVFAALSRPYSHGQSGNTTLGNQYRRPSDKTEYESIRKFLDFSRTDVLGLLLKLVPTSDRIHDGPLSNAWGIICAGLLSHQKSGSDKFVITVMNAHLGQLDITAHHYLENWLLETLRDGNFILSQADRRSFRNKSQPSSAYPNEDPKAVDDFFSAAIEKLLSILKDNNLTRIIPARVLDVGKSIVARLDPSSQQQQAAPYFLCTRWLFASYLSSLITSPESYGMLLSHHISSTARQRILHELAHRARRIMEGVAYSWKQTSPVMPNLVAEVEGVVGLFRLDSSEVRTVPDSQEPGSEITDGIGNHNRHITVCASEVMNAIRTLYPWVCGELHNGSYIPSGSTLRSSASSISGLSLFRTMSPSEPPSPRSGRCAAVPDLSTHVGGPHPASVPMGSDSDHEYLSTEDSFGHRLREVCIELAVFTGCGSDVGSCDLFSESWTSLKMCFDRGTTIWIDRVISSICCLPGMSGSNAEPHAEQHVDPYTFDFISTGIHTLLDGSLSATTAKSSPPQDVKSLHASLITQLESARANSYHQGDFAKAHLFFRLAKATTSISAETTSYIFQAVAMDLRHSVDTCRLKVQNGEARIEKLTDRIDSQQVELRSVSYINDRLREKMWYTADIQRAGHYEELRKVITALRVMASSARPKTDKKKPLLRHRSASKSLNHSIQLKAEAATLELLSAPVEKGGTNKLSDVQIDMTLRWMETRGVERICRAEERIHRFCSELTRCLDHFVGQSIVEHPILWSSQLFQNQRPLSGYGNSRVGTPNTDSSALAQLRSMYDHRVSGSYKTHMATQWGRSITPSRTAMHSNLAARSISPKSIQHDYFGCRSPTLTHKSSGTLWSTFSPGPQSPSSATSYPSRALSPMSTGRPSSRHSCLQQSQASFLDELKQNLTSLLLSDFHDLFRSGSETDKAMRKILKLRLPARNQLPESMEYKHDVSLSSFDFDEVFRMLLRRFELQASPYVKLDILLELQSMLKAHRADRGLEDHPRTPQSNTVTHRGLGLRIDTSSAPRTSRGHDSTILSFRQLFQDPQLRPKTLFRDLQYIASLVPVNILDSTPRGRAFWNATIAALDLKEENCISMVEAADQIIQHHTFTRGHSHVASVLQAKRDATAFSPPTPQPSDPNIADLTMSDAATLLQLTAKEGIPAAQRELATLYLTHPELLGVCISPFSKVRDVFKDLDKDVEGVSEKYDPMAMAVARHWMELSAKGGDGPAAMYLRDKHELNMIP